MKRSVLIVNYNGVHYLPACIAALRPQLTAHDEVIVVDNASTDASLAWLNMQKDLICIENTENRGFAQATNQAATRAVGELLICLNPDTIVAPKWLECLSQAAETFPNHHLFASLLLEATNPNILDGAGDSYHLAGAAFRNGKGRNIANSALAISSPYYACFSACAAGMAVRSTAFNAVGGMDALYFCYGEDVAFGWKLYAHYRQPAVLVCDAKLQHHGSALSGKYSDFSVFHGTRNRIWLHARHMPRGLWLPLLPYTLLMECGLMVKHAIQRTLIAHFKGLLSGYGNVLRALRCKGLRCVPYRAALSPICLVARTQALQPIKPPAKP